VPQVNSALDAMSYDYWIFKSPVELLSLNQIQSAEVLGLGDWRSDARALLEASIPELVWADAEGERFSARLGDSEARFELRIWINEGVTLVSIRVSYRQDQLSLVRSCAKAIGGYAFDMQSCERIWPEKSSGI